MLTEDLLNVSLLALSSLTPRRRERPARAHKLLHKFTLVSKASSESSQ